MVSIEIRDVPEALRNQLAATAASRGQTMQSYLLSVLHDEAQRLTNIELLRRLDELDGGDSFSINGIAQEIAAVRDDRDRRNTEAR